jgi:PAS domain S-box-containing protein
MEEFLNSDGTLLEAIIETSPAGITVLDKEGNIVYANHHAQRILRVSKDEILNRSYDDKKWEIRDLDGNAYPKEKLPFSLVKKTKESVFDVRHSINCDNREPILLSINASPLLTSEGDFDGAVCNLIDITNEYNTLRRLKRSQRKLKERVKELNCIYQLSNLLADTSLSIEQVLKKAVDLLPPSFQFPNITTAQLFYNHLKFESKNFRKSNNKLSSKIRFPYGILALKVFQLENKPFLEEEKELIEEFLQRIKQYIEKKIEEKKYKSLFHSSPYPIVLINTEGEIIDINETSKGFLGYDSKRFIGKNIKDIMQNFINIESRHIKERFRKLIKKEHLVPDEYKVRRNNGDIAWIKIQSSLMHLGGRTLVQSIIQDISKEKQIKANLKKVNKKKTEILRKTSHDLKTPLISIKGYADLLLRLHAEEFSENALEKLQYITKGCTRLESSINEILEGSKLISSDINLNKTKNDLSNLIMKNINELKPQAEKKSIEVTHNLEKDLITRFNQRQINNVIGNLLTNSIKYTPRNGRIEISSLKEGKYIKTTVKDDGIGLTEEEKNHLFQKYKPFQRENKDLNIEKSGSGLGLYFSKKVIERHGGTIGATSKGRHKGSTFYFTLPLEE